MVFEHEVEDEWCYQTAISDFQNFKNIENFGKCYFKKKIPKNRILKNGIYVREPYQVYMCRGERGTSVHGADTFTSVFGKTIGRRCSRKCKIIASLADYHSTYEVTKCLQNH